MSADNHAPILMLTVNMGGGRKEKLSIKKGGNPATIAKQFSVEHHLSQTATTSLTNFIAQSVNSTKVPSKNQLSNSFCLESMNGLKPTQQTVYQRLYSISLCPSNNKAPLSKYYKGLVSQRRKKNASVYSSNSSFCKENFNSSISGISTHSVSIYSNNISKSISNYRLTKLEKEKEREDMKVEQEMQSCTFRPSIGGQSNYLADLNRSSCQNNKSVFDSLYDAPKTTKAQSNVKFTFSPNVESKLPLSISTKEYLEQPILQRLSQPKETSIQTIQNKIATIPTKKIEIYKENKDVFNYLYSTQLQRPEPTECIKKKPYDMTNSNAILDAVKQKSLTLLFKYISNNSSTTSVHLINDCASRNVNRN